MPKNKVPIACEECRRKNYYLIKSNDARLVLKKFCKSCNKKTEHKEEK